MVVIYIYKIKLKHFCSQNDNKVFLFNSFDEPQK